MRLPFRRPAPATVIAFVSLLVALTSTAYAGGLITGRNVKDGSLTSADVQDGSLRSRDVKNGVLSGADVEPDSLGGKQIEEGTLGTVPRARAADTAGSARTVEGGNRILATFHSDAIPIVDFGHEPIAGLDVPAGSYAVIAKATLVNASDTNAPVVDCDLDGVGGDAQQVSVPPKGRVPLVLTSTGTLSRPGRASIGCIDAGIGDVQLEQTKITAIAVGDLQSAGF